MNEIQNEDTKKLCLAKLELEKILAQPITSVEIPDLVKAHEKGCIDCSGINIECDYYKSIYIGKKLS